MGKPVVFAHRGASAYAPENTMAAFKKALEMGADGIELDVHLTLDEEVVVIHDHTINRTSNGSGWVKDMTIKELKCLDFGSWFGPEYKNERIPLLEEVLYLLSDRDIILNIEIKNAAFYYYEKLQQKVVDLLKKYNMINRVIISSFNHYSLVEIKEIAPEIKTAPLYGESLFEPWEYAKKIKAFAIHPLFYTLVPEIINQCKEHKIAVNPYTVDQPEFIKKLALYGVDGIITNVPDVALKTL